MYGTTERGVNICTGFVYNGNDIISGFNFDIDFLYSVKNIRLFIWWITDLEM